MSAPSLVWFRQDLRLTDHPALHHAAARGKVVAVYILDDGAAQQWKLGGAGRWWLHHSLAALAQSLQRRGMSLILRRGDSAAQLKKLLQETGADAIYWNRRYEPWAIAQDQMLKKQFQSQGINVQSFNAALLFEPWDIHNQQGGPFKVFTAFWKHCLKRTEPSAPLPSPRLHAITQTIPSDTLQDWQLLPSTPNWAGGLRKTWQPGAAGAQKRLERFLAQALDDYATGRDYPAIEATSKLSPHLHFGEISPRQVWHAVHFHQHAQAASEHNVQRFLSELGWREFCYHLLYHYPDFPEQPFRREFTEFAWQTNAEHLKRWQQGQTGYPIVDAGMRELWRTGYMHNRVRMITASFLTKHLLIAWQEGAKWFWNTLVDADLANNSVNWQWVAGCGVDAAPYFRIFNPILQSQKFDPEGKYLRRWLPELAHLPNSELHAPWESGHSISGYPAPIVEHSYARQHALEAYKALRKKA